MRAVRLSDLEALGYGEYLRADTDDDRTPECFLRMQAGQKIGCAGNDGSVLCIQGCVDVHAEDGSVAHLDHDPIHVRTPRPYVMHALTDCIVQILGKHALRDVTLPETACYSQPPRMVWAGAEAFYAVGDQFVVGPDELQRLRDAVKGSSRQRVRLCTHADTSAKLHEMFVCYTRDAKVARHKHLAKDESFHVLEGDLDFVMFNETGDVTQIIQMGDKHSGKPFYVRVPRDTYHIVSVNSDICILHEGTAGPFDRAHTVWAAA